MAIDKNKVNAILLEFQEILKKFKPNTSELEMINSKISKMTARNVQKQIAQKKTTSSKLASKPTTTKSPKKWYKIKVE
jgi:hypothetical protein